MCTWPFRDANITGGTGRFAGATGNIASWGLPFGTFCAIASGAGLCARFVVPYYLALKAEGLHLADLSSEALEAISEAETLAERSEERWWSAELHCLRGVFLAAIGSDEIQIEVSFCEAIRTARRQKSISLAKRAEATYAEYRARRKV
jgi:hypothetical protein